MLLPTSHHSAIKFVSFYHNHNSVSNTDSNSTSFALVTGALEVADAAGRPREQHARHGRASPPPRRWGRAAGAAAAAATTAAASSSEQQSAPPPSLQRAESAIPRAQRIGGRHEAQPYQA